MKISQTHIIKLLSGLIMFMGLCLWLFVNQLQSQTQEITQPPTINFTTVADVPEVTGLENLISQISAQGIYVMDVESGATLLSQNPDQHFYPASTVKLMTAIVAREEYALDSVIKISQLPEIEGNKIGLSAGQEFRVKDLLTAMLMSSANDAAYVLTKHSSMTQDEFVRLMNLKARELHLNKTIFYNSSGLDHQDQVVSPHDLAILARQLIKDDTLRNMVSQYKGRISDISQTHEYRLLTTNQLLERTDVLGIKTGTTPLAQEVLVSLVNINHHQVIVVIMNSQDRYADTLKIIDWLNKHQKWHEIN